MTCTARHHDARVQDRERSIIRPADEDIFEAARCTPAPSELYCWFRLISVAGRPGQSDRACGAGPGIWSWVAGVDADLVSRRPLCLGARRLRTELFRRWQLPARRGCAGRLRRRRRCSSCRRCGHRAIETKADHPADRGVDAFPDICLAHPEFQLPADWPAGRWRSGQRDLDLAGQQAIPPVARPGHAAGEADRERHAAPSSRCRPARLSRLG